MGFGTIMVRGMDVRCGRCDKWQRASDVSSVPAAVAAKVGADTLREQGWTNTKHNGWVCADCKGKHT